MRLPRVTIAGFSSSARPEPAHRGRRAALPHRRHDPDLGITCALISATVSGIVFLLWQLGSAANEMTYRLALVG